MAVRPPLSLAFMRLAGAGTLLAGLIGILVEVHIVPYRDLFDLNPRRIVFALQDPVLRLQYILHFASMTVAGLAAIPGMYVLQRLMRHSSPGRMPLVAFLLITAGLAVFSYASALNAVVFPHLGVATVAGLATGEAIDVAARVNRHTVIVVSTAGAAFLVGVLLFSYGLWRTRLFSRGLAALGVVATLLLALFGALIYADRMPFIWGLTFPPPPEYLLSLWFLFVGAALVSRGRRQRRGQVFN